MAPIRVVTSFEDHGDGDAERRRFEEKYRASAVAFREALKPLFLFMLRHGIDAVTVEREGTIAHTEVS